MAKSATRRGAGRPPWTTRWLQDHVRALSSTLARLRARPLAALMTALVIGVTLALPTGLEALLTDLGSTGQALGQRSLQVSLFLKDSVDAAAGKALTARLGRRQGVASARYTSKAQALAEFRRQDGAGEALDLLPDNPLPATIQLQLDPDQPRQQAQALERRLAALPEVEQARMDPQWLQRLYALAALLQRAVLLFGVALSITVLIVVSNTIRLDVENRRKEIEVMKLLGAANGYVRRPFLYMGLCYGFGGAVLAWLLATLGLWALREPVRRLAGLYHSSFSLPGPGLGQFGMLLAAALILGWIGAFYTVSGHLQRIEPN